MRKTDSTLRHHAFCAFPSDALVVVDAGLEHLGQLLSALPAGMAVELLDPQADPIAQITGFVARHPGLQSLHLIAHGAPGAILFGRQTLCLDTLAQHGVALAQLGERMAPDGEWFIYGCEVAKGDTGRAFVEALRASTNLKIAAASHKVGHEGLGGRWALDVMAGTMLSQSVVAGEWSGVLNGSPELDLDGFGTPGTSNEVDYMAVIRANAYQGAFFTTDFLAVMASGPTSTNSQGLANYGELRISFDKTAFVDGPEEALKLGDGFTNLIWYPASTANQGDTAFTFNGSDDYLYSISVVGNVATITFKGDGGNLTPGQVEYILDNIHYTNSKEIPPPTGGNRVFTVTLTDEQNQNPAQTTFTALFGPQAPADTTPPTLTNWTYSSDGTKLILTFDEPLDTTNNIDVGAFTIVVNGTTVHSPSSLTATAAANGSTLEITLQDALITGDDIYWSHTSPTGADDSTAVQDVAGNDWGFYESGASGAATPVVLPQPSDTTPPVLQSAETSSDGTQVILTYDEALRYDWHSTPGAYTVNVDGSPITVSQVSIVQNGDKVTLTLATPITNGQTVTVAYEDPSPNNDNFATQDLAGNDAPSFSATSVTNNVAASGPAIDLDGSTSQDTSRTVAFDATPNAMKFTVDNTTNLSGGTEFGVLVISYDPDDFTASETLTLLGTNPSTTTPIMIGPLASPSLTAPGYNIFDIGGGNSLRYRSEQDMLTGVVTITFMGSSTETLSASEAEFVLDALTYGNTEYPAFTGGNRVFTIELFDSQNGTSTTQTYTVTPPAADTTPPVFQSAETSSDGSKIILTYDEALDLANKAATTDFVVTVGGQVVTVSGVAVIGSTVELTLASPVAHGDTVTVAYADPTGNDDANATQDAAGNDAADISPAASVTNNVPAGGVTVDVDLDDDPDVPDRTIAFDPNNDMTFTLANSTNVTGGSTLGKLEIGIFMPDFTDGTDETLTLRDTNAPQNPPLVLGNLGALTASSGVVSVNGWDIAYTVAVSGSAVTITFVENQGTGLSDAQAEYILDNLVYANSASSPSGSDRYFFIDLFESTNTNRDTEKLIITMTADTTPPDAPTINLATVSDTGESNTDALSNDTTPTFTGTAEAGAEVTVYWLDGNNAEQVLGTTTADGSGNWSFTPVVPLTQGEYNVFAKATDAANNTGPASSPSVFFKLDTSAPTLDGPNSNPADNATDVAVDADIRIAFSENIAFGTSGTIVIRNLTDNTLVGILTVSRDGNGNVTFSGLGTASINKNQLTINPTDNLPAGKDFSLWFSPGVVTDIAGNQLAAISDDTVYNFRTVEPDTTPPVFVSAATSSDGTKVILTYDEDLALASNAPGGAFTVLVNGQPRTVTAVTNNGKTVELTLASPIAAGQAVTVAYDDPTSGDDSFATQDLLGNDAASLSATSVSNTVPGAPDPGPGPGPSPGPGPGPNPPPGEDDDGVDSEEEAAVPGVLGPGGVVVPGDGNGDGVPDAQQAAVTSLRFRETPAISTDDQAPQTFITLVAGGADGKALDSAARITDIRQLDAPQDLAPGMNAPLGLISFTATIPDAGSAVNFSLYVDPDLGINGYWKQDSDGTWINLASEAYGGRIVEEGGRLRLDFIIEDGGMFDADGLANGVITDPGALASMPLSIVEHQAEPAPDTFWF